MRNAEAALHDAGNVPVLEAANECALVDGKSQGQEPGEKLTWKAGKGT